LRKSKECFCLASKKEEGKVKKRPLIWKVLSIRFFEEVPKCFFKRKQEFFNYYMYTTATLIYL